MAIARLVNQDGSHDRDIEIPNYPGTPPEGVYAKDGVFINVTYPNIDASADPPVYRRAVMYAATER